MTASQSPAPAAETTQTSTDVEQQPATQEEAPKPNRVKRAATHVKAFITASKLWRRQPCSHEQAWARTAVDMNRVPDRSDFWAALWELSNRTDRYVWFLLYEISPAFLAGGVLYVASRPTRRWGTVIALLLVGVAVPAMLS